MRLRQRVITLTELRDAIRELEAARALFNEATDPDMIDRAIALMAAAEAHIRSLCRVPSTSTAA